MNGLRMHCPTRCTSSSFVGGRIVLRPSGVGRIKNAGCVRISANLANLEPWQSQKLEEAYMNGRKKFKVTSLAKELSLDRKDILSWMKNFSTLPDSTRESILEARRKAVEAKKERKELLYAAKSKKERVIEQDITQNWKDYTPRGRVEYLKTKPISKSALETLEKVYARMQYPSEEAVQSFFELYQLPRDRIVDWFEEKRAQDEDYKKRKRQKRALKAKFKNFDPLD